EAGEGGEVAEDGADVVVVGEVFEDDDDGRVAEEAGEVGAGGADAEGEDAAVDVEPDDRVHERLVDKVDGGVGWEGVDGVLHGLEARVGEQDGAGGVRGRDEASEDEFPFGDEEAAGGVEAGALEFGVTDPEVVGDAGVGGRAGGRGAGRGGEGGGARRRKTSSAAAMKGRPGGSKRVRGSAASRAPG